MHVLEHTLVECRQALSHTSRLHPMEPSPTNGSVVSSSTIPTVDELLYRVEAASLAAETNDDVATATL
jgi:hypothetical protein